MASQLNSAKCCFFCFCSPCFQPAADGLCRVKSPQPSNLPTVLAPVLIPNIHTDTQNSSVLACPRCLRVTGCGGKWHRATKCHLAPFTGAMQSPLAALFELVCPWPYLRHRWCHAEEAGTGLALEPASVLYTASLSKGNSSKVCELI